MSLVTNDNLKSSLTQFKGKVDTELSVLNSQVGKINFAQKTMALDLDYGTFTWNSNQTITTTVPLKFNNVINGNLTISEENGGIHLSANKKYLFLCNLYPLAYTRGVFLYNITDGIKIPNASVSYATSSQATYIYTNDHDTDVSFVLEKSDTVRYEWASVNVVEIGRMVNPVEYIDQSKGLQDTPVGTIYEALSTNDVPKGFLPTDGRELTIGTYPEFEGYLINNFGAVNYYGGDGETTYCLPSIIKLEGKEVSLDMTSNTTPAPFKATASGSAGPTMDPFYAFQDSPNTGVSSLNKFWLNANTTDDGSVNTTWLAIDLGTPTEIRGIYLKAVSFGDKNTSYNRSPKSFTLQGSEDGATWEDIKAFTTTWSSYGEKQYFGLDDIVKYRHYRLYKMVSTGDRVSIDNWTFLTPTRCNIIKVKPTYYMQVNTSLESNYSYDEKQIGYWVDSKPLYQKTIEVGSSSSTEYSSTERILDIGLTTTPYDKVVKLEGVYDSSNGILISTLPHVPATTSNYMGIYFSRSDSKIHIVFPNGYSKNSNLPGTFIITIQYTKTTD